MKKRIKLIALSFCFILVTSSCQSDSYEARKSAAKELLSKDCNFITYASTEFLREKHPVIASLAAAVIADRCDCLIDSISMQFANQYSLDEIQQMQKQPIETVENAVQNVLSKNGSPIKGCFSL